MLISVHTVMPLQKDLFKINAPDVGEVTHVGGGATGQGPQGGQSTCLWRFYIDRALYLHSGQGTTLC
jgi:hypothetical protein